MGKTMETILPSETFKLFNGSWNIGGPLFTVKAGLSVIITSQLTEAVILPKIVSVAVTLKV